jgi:transcriptional regulator with XRE-family HTH domain
MEKSGVRQKQVADAMGVGHTYISNIFNGHDKASPAVAARILAEVIKLESAPPLPIVRGRGCPKWVERENMLELAKRYSLAAREIGRQIGVKPASRAAEYLSGRKTPHPDLAREMERVIVEMVGGTK